MTTPRPSLAFRTAIAGAVLLSMTAGQVASAHAACDATTQARIEFLETRLDEGRRHSNWWYKGWMGIFIVGVVAQSGRAAAEKDSGERADFIFSAGKSLVGVLRLSLDPQVARFGGDPIRAVAVDDCARRLAVAEGIMAEAADQATMRYSWTTHLTSLGMNLGVALLISEYWKEESTAWTSFAVSEVSAEAHIWSRPTRQIQDWEDYQQRFNGAPAAELESKLQLAAGPRGLGLMWSF